MISISNLHKYYNKGGKNETYALQGIELSFDSTGLVCILGESGCGKTTLLNAIGGLDSFDKGSIEVDDEIIKKYKMRQIEKIRNDKYGYIFQNYYLLNDRSVLENVKAALSMYKLTEEEKLARVEYVLDALGLTKYKKKSVANLSGGQQQRVSIARALVKSPEIILADEPTGNLDEENTLKIMGILKAISKKCLVILVTHERDMAKLFADRIIEIIDGKIQSDNANNSKDSYTKSADNNIYLAEYEMEKLEDKHLDIGIYKKSDEKQKKLKIKLVFDGKKIYVKNESDYDILLESVESDFSILEGNAPKLTVETVQDVDFSMEGIKEKSINKLPFREIRNIARENRRALGKKQAFMVITMLAAAVMLTLVLADYIYKKHINLSEVVKSDSHVVVVNLKRTEDSFGYYFNKLDYCNSFANSSDKYYVYPKASPKAGLIYTDIAQIDSINKEIKGACMVPLSILDESDLIYGRMPESPLEIVVDKMVLDKFCSDNVVFGNLFDDISDFIGYPLKYYAVKGEREIVGISDIGEPDVFMYDSVYRSFSGAPLFAPLSELQAAYPGRFDDVVLGREQMLLSRREHDTRFVEEIDDNWIHMGDTNTESFNEVGIFEEEFYAEMIVADDVYKELEKKLYTDTAGFSLYVYDKDDIDSVIEEFANKKADSYDENELKVEVVYDYQNQLDEYKEKTKTDINTKNIVTMVVFILSVIVVYFSMKNNISARKEQIIVYRLIGINPSSIIKSFVLEMGALTAIICVPVIFVTSLVLKTISSIKALGINYFFSWPSMVILAAVMILANVFVCYLSVASMIKRPPVRLQ